MKVKHSRLLYTQEESKIRLKVKVALAAKFIPFNITAKFDKNPPSENIHEIKKFIQNLQPDRM